MSSAALRAAIRRPVHETVRDANSCSVAARRDGAFFGVAAKFGFCSAYFSKISINAYPVGNEGLNSGEPVREGRNLSYAVDVFPSLF